MHTPGPWTVTGQGQVYHQPPMPPNTFVPYVGIAQVYGESVNPDSEANARLIAAAPKLLEACVKALDYISRIRESGDCGFFDKQPIELLLESVIPEATGVPHV